MTTAPTSSKPFSVRFYWRVAIIALWLVAGVAIAVTVKDRFQQKKASSVASGQQEDRIDLSSSKSFTKNPDGTITVHPQPAGTVFNIWDPNGIEDFQLVDTNGKVVTKQDMLGKPWVVCFIFTRCAHSCPAITRVMKEELQDRLKKVDVRLVSLSVDPENDTPEILQDYAKHKGVDSNKWLFLTGDKEKIFHLIHHSFKQVAYDDQGKPMGFQVAHSNNILHINATGVVQGKYDGTDRVDMARLRKALKKEVKEIQSQKKSSSRSPVVAPLP